MLWQWLPNHGMSARTYQREKRTLSTYYQLHGFNPRDGTMHSFVLRQRLGKRVSCPYKKKVPASFASGALSIHLRVSGAAISAGESIHNRPLCLCPEGSTPNGTVVFIPNVAGLLRGLPRAGRRLLFPDNCRQLWSHF